MTLCREFAALMPWGCHHPARHGREALLLSCARLWRAVRACRKKVFRMQKIARNSVRILIFKPEISCTRNFRLSGYSSLHQLVARAPVLQAKEVRPQVAAVLRAQQTADVGPAS